MKFDAIPSEPGTLLAYSTAVEYTRSYNRPQQAILLERGGWRAAASHSLLSRPRRASAGKDVLVLVRGFTDYAHSPAPAEDARAYTVENARRWLLNREEADEPPHGWMVTVVRPRSIVDTWAGWAPRLEALEAQEQRRHEDQAESDRLAAERAALIRERLEAAGFKLEPREQGADNVRMSAARFLAMLDALGAPSA